VSTSRPAATGISTIGTGTSSADAMFIRMRSNETARADRS
jgi:hypothetical protein